MRSPASGSLATADPATIPERRSQPTSVTEEPMTVASRGRLYTTEDIRRRLGCNDENAGRGTAVTVKIDDVDRNDEWIHVETAVFHATLATDGVIRIPSAVRDELGLSTGVASKGSASNADSAERVSEGDSVRVSIRINNNE